MTNDAADSEDAHGGKVQGAARGQTTGAGTRGREKARTALATGVRTRTQRTPKEGEERRERAGKSGKAKRPAEGARGDAASKKGSAIVGDT